MAGLLRDWLAAGPEPDPLVVETSGSTGAPKRVVLSRSAVVASARATAERLGSAGQPAAGQWLLTLPASYVAGIQVMVRSLLAGHEPALLDEHPSLAAATATMTNARFVSLVPTQLHRLLDLDEEVVALQSFQTILLGGGPIEPALRVRAREAGLHIVATYGASETSGGCVYDGFPLPGVELALDRHGRIMIRGPMLFDEYEGDPMLTRAALVDGWFHTSDMGRIDADGELHVLGRKDDVVVSGGVNVPATAVATRLREHPEVSAAAVVGVPDEEWGQLVVAFVVGAVTLGQARDWVAECHPRAWAPRRVVHLSALPLLPNGKVDRRALTERADNRGAVVNPLGPPAAASDAEPG